MAVSSAKNRTGSNSKLLKMQELSKKTGVPPGTIRYYINEQLLPKPIKTHRNMAYYDESYVGKIRLIKELQEKRFLPLSIIKQMLEQRESSMETEEIKTLLELEGKLFKNISSLPEYQPLNMDELSERTGVSKEFIEELEEMGIVSRSAYDLFDEDCARIVDILAKLRDVGYREEAGFGSDHIKMYKDMIEVLARQEVRTFSKAVTGKLSFAEMATMAETGIDLLNSLIGILRKRIILSMIREPDLG